MQLTVLAGLHGLVPPIVCTIMLVSCTHLLGARFTAPYVALGIISALLCLIVIGNPQQHRHSIPSNGLTIAGRVVAEWAIVVATLLLIGYATKTSEIFSRRALFLWFATTPAAMAGTLVVLHHWMHAVVVSSTHARRALIVGASSMGMQLADLLGTRPDLGFKLQCVFDPDNALDDSAGADFEFEHRSDLAAVHDYVNAESIETVFVALPIETPRTQAVLQSLRDTTSSVYLVPDISIFDLIQAHSDDIQGIPVIALCESPFRGLQGALKRATDVVFASIMLLLAAPVMLMIALAVKSTSRGAVIFKQHRYGLDGRKIAVYKFRTMAVSENGPRIVQAKRDDARVTPVGRFLRRTSLDELPQLLNVLQGSMSLVGPRPHAVAHNEQYRKLIAGYMVRHKVPPGITGLAQVNGCRGETTTVEDMRRRVEYDLEYLRQWCWLLDVKILVKTCGLLFHDKHAY